MASPASARPLQNDDPVLPTNDNRAIASDVRLHVVALPIPRSGVTCDAGSWAERREAALAWKLFCFNWLLLAGAGIAFGLSLLLTEFRLRPQGYLIVMIAAAVYGLIGYINAVSRQRRAPWIFSMLTAIAQMMLVVSVMISMTYIATSANLPLCDATLLAFDRAIGFDFRGFLDFVNDRTWLIYILAAGYRSISWPIWIIVVALPLAGYYRRTSEYVCAFLLALIATTCITMIVPAIGVYGAMGLVAADFPNIVPQGYYDTLRDAPLLRDGTLRTLDLFQLAGVVTFPSFHAAAAVLYAWALWPLRWLRPFNVLCNGALLVATPIGGGHFLADVIAGMAVAAASIYATHRIVRALAAAPGPSVRFPALPAAISAHAMEQQLPSRG